MADQSCDLSVIIVNWNAAPFLESCLRSVLAAEAEDGLRIEVWLVDNASTDGSLALVRQHFPQVRLIANSQNRGFAAANNQALKQARGRYAMLLNPDTEVCDGALSRMVAFLDEHSQVGIVGPRLTLRSGKIQGGAAGYEPSLWTVFNYSFFLYKVAPRFFRGMWLAQKQYRSREPVRVDWVSGAALMVRMAAVREVGLLDESFFMYAEDIEWCRRLRRKGWEVYCLPEVRIIHHIGRSIRQRGPEFFAVNVHSLDSYYRSQYGPGVVKLFHLCGTSGFLVRAIAYKVLHLVHRKEVYRELSGQWWACTRAGFRHLLGRVALTAGRNEVETRNQLAGWVRETGGSEQ